MPKQQTRTRRARRMPQLNAVAAAPPTWAPGSSGTELKWYSANQGNFQLYHNVPVSYYNLANLLNNIVAGTGASNRIGSRIFVKDVDFRMVCNNKSDRPNVTYRFCVCAGPAASNTDAFSDLFNGGQFTSVHTPTNSVLLADSFFPMNQGATMSASTKERSSTHSVSLRINKPVVFNSDGEATTRLIGFVIAYDANGTLVTDNIASIAYTSWRITFTDA